MRNRVLGAIGVLWGGLILLGRLQVVVPAMEPGPTGPGRQLGWCSRVLLLVVGLYYLVRGGGSARPKSP